MNLVLVDEPAAGLLLANRINLAEGGSHFSCRMIEPGIVSYLNTPERDVILLRKETIDRCLASARNNPLTIDHVPMDGEVPVHMKSGEVAGLRYNAEDGWYYAEGEVENDHAKHLIRKGWMASCAYKEKKVIRNNSGAKYHGFHYDKEIVELEFHHLAIVKKPRYEGTVFRLNSLVNQPTMHILKLLKKLVTRENDAAGKPVETTKVETHEINSAVTIDVDGEQVRLNSLVDAWKKVSSTGAIVAATDDEIEIPGEGDSPACKVRLNDLVSAYRTVRKNEAAEAEAADKKKKDDEAAAAAARSSSAQTEEEKKAAAAAQAETDKLAAEETARKNAAGKESFLTLQGARFRSGSATEGGYSTTSGSLREKCERGAKKY